MNKIKQVLIGLCCFLTGCHDVSDYKNETPEFNLETYFNGPIEAWGVIQDYKGKVTRRFKINLNGEWDNDIGTLNEEFKFYDGEEQSRSWKIKRIDSRHYEGYADDIVGIAKGHVIGNTMKWAYTMNLKVNNKYYHVKFDDWMFMMEDGVLINRSYLKKFGITVAELTIFMKKGEQ